jgi:hypothetical protein
MGDGPKGEAGDEPRRECVLEPEPEPDPDPELLDVRECGEGWADAVRRCARTLADVDAPRE